MFLCTSTFSQVQYHAGYLNGSCTIRNVYNFELSTCVVISAPPRFLVFLLETPKAINNHTDQKPDMQMLQENLSKI